MEVSVEAGEEAGEEVGMEVGWDGSAEVTCTSERGGGRAGQRRGGRGDDRGWLLWRWPWRWQSRCERGVVEPSVGEVAAGCGGGCPGRRRGNVIRGHEGHQGAGALSRAGRRTAPPGKWRSDHAAATPTVAPTGRGSRWAPSAPSQHPIPKHIRLGQPWPAPASPRPSRQSEIEPSLGQTFASLPILFE